METPQTRVKCEKHGIWPCGICHREELGLPKKPFVAREDGVRGKKNAGDDERFVTVHWKDVDRLREVAPEAATHVHFCGGVASMPIAKKLVAYFNELRVINMAPSRMSDFSEKVRTFLSLAGVAVSFEYVRAKGGRQKASDGRPDSGWLKKRAKILQLGPEAMERLEELVRFKIPEAILFKRYWQIDCPDKYRITLVDVATSLGCATSPSGVYALQAVYCYIVGERGSYQNISSVISKISREVARAKAEQGSAG